MLPRLTQTKPTASAKLPLLSAIALTMLCPPLQVLAGAAPDCTPVTAMTLNNPVVLGNGTPGSISQASLQAAINQGGQIVLNQGSDPSTILLTSPLQVNRETLIDGGGLVTLDGQGQSRIFLINNSNNLEYDLVLQNLHLRRGATPGESGAAIFKPVGGPWQAVGLFLINSSVRDSHAIAVEQDGGGGAIYGIGMSQIVVANSEFVGNSGSNGGAIYSLGSRQVKIVDSWFQQNQATGNGGNPGNGGNGGAIGVDGAERQVSICRTQIVDNRANAFGAGFFSVMYDNLSRSDFIDTNFELNQNPTTTAFAGAAYLQGGPFRIERSSFINNQANGVGALFLGPGVNGDLLNSSFYGNIARASLGGAISIDGSAVVRINHSTIANNHAPGPVAFAGGIAVPASNQVRMSNSILANNTGGNVFNPWNILNPVADGGGNVQFPRFRPNNQMDVAATPSVLWADPLLEAAADNGGFTPSLAMPISSPAVGAATGTPSVTHDQRGVMRSAPADAGAYEVDTDVIYQNGFENSTKR